MAYDQKKLSSAINKWLKKRCNVGYGQVYFGVLLADFEEFCAETGALQATPGHSVFGEALTKMGFERKRVNGLQYVTGLDMKNPPKIVVENRRAQSFVSGEVAEDERQDRAKEAQDAVQSELDTVRDDAAVKRRMKKETKARLQEAGNE
jgi:hypothetical protein